MADENKKNDDEMPDFSDVKSGASSTAPRRRHTRRTK